MIILEGCDNSGKTTLAKKLSEDLCLPLVPSSGPRTDHELKKYLHLFIERTDAFVMDRICLISEGIYRSVCRGQEVPDRWWYLLMLARMRPVVIYCRPSATDILNFGEREQMEGVIRNGERLIAEYDRTMKILWERFRFPVINYNWRYDDYETLLNRIKFHGAAYDREINALARLTADN